MFTVKTPEEALSVIETEFRPLLSAETVPLSGCCSRMLAGDILSSECVPGFTRSTVDGYAVKASDTFGCSDSIPALLTLSGEILMGEEAPASLTPGCCYAVPTGGAVPEGADAVVMIEYTENYGDGTIGIEKPASPGMNMIYKGEDLVPGKTVLRAGRRINASDIGALASLGITGVRVCRKPLIGIISTGDELIPIEEAPEGGQIRDVNTHMLDALCREMGTDTRLYGIVTDQAELLSDVLEKAIAECDLVLLSGGSSVGARDAAATVIEKHGSILFHGIAMKPGKPTILGKAGNKPVFGLPGHPVAAFFITKLFVRKAVAVLTASDYTARTAPALLTEALSTNHGRSESMGVRLMERGGKLFAKPVHTKSGLISALAGTDGYITIPRDCEGLPAGAAVNVSFYSAD